MISDPKTESIAIPGTYSQGISPCFSSKQSSIENSITISNVWKTANMKISCVPKDKQSSKPGRSNSDISVLGNSVLKSVMTKRQSNS